MLLSLTDIGIGAVIEDGGVLQSFETCVAATQATDAIAPMGDST